MDQIFTHMPMLVFYLQQMPAYGWYVINAVFSLIMIVGLWLVYYSFRRALGHQRFKGHWYNRERFHALLQEVYSGVRDGRLPDSETMRLLDRHIYGRKGSALRDWNGAGWL